MPWQAWQAWQDARLARLIRSFRELFRVDGEDHFCGTLSNSFYLHLLFFQCAPSIIIVDSRISAHNPQYGSKKDWCQSPLP